MPSTRKKPHPRRQPVAPLDSARKPLPLGADLALPHERDEAAHATAPVPDAVIVQAKRDIDAGLVDTGMRATPGLDAERRARLVPGPGGKPPGTAR